MTPKDEQNSRIAEREKFLAVLDADISDAAGADQSVAPDRGVGILGENGCASRNLVTRPSLSEASKTRVASS